LIVAAEEKENKRKSCAKAKTSRHRGGNNLATDKIPMEVGMILKIFYSYGGM
jgi:hypothetical protein